MCYTRFPCFSRVFVVVNTEMSKRRGRPRSFNLDDVTARAAFLFWERGYEGVSVDELTLTMGITTQSFYAAFGSKQQLHYDALAWYEREVTRPVREALNADRDIVQAVRATLEASARDFTRPDRPPGCMRSMAGLCASRDNQAVAQHAAGLRRDTVAFIKARLDQGVADQQLEADADTAALSLYLNATVVGMSVAAQDGADTDALLAIARTALSVLPVRRRGRSKRSVVVT